MDFIKQNKRRPSKYHPEDRDMHNWIKHNKKLMNRGLMPANRVERFKTLLDTVQKYRRINQNTYAHTGQELNLFDTSD